MTAVCPCRAAAPVDAGAAEYIEQIERRAAGQRLAQAERLLDLDPGHVRTRQHYDAMLAELLAGQ